MMKRARWLTLVSLLMCLLLAAGSVTAIAAPPDVLVVGGGLAGLSAAIKAAEAGANVTLIEKMPMLGGSSMLSGGGLGATNTSEQKKHGIEDTNESWKALWVERQATSPDDSGFPDWDRVDALIANSADSIDWYLSLGYQFRKPEGFGVDPVERLHFPDPEGNGYVLTSFLGKKAEELGVTIMLETAATELIVEDGAVVGVLATTKEGDVTLPAKSVVLACGGFARNEDLMARFTPENLPYWQYTVSSVGNTGDGILMAEAVGAVPYENPWVIGLGMTTPVREMSSFYWYGMHLFVNGEGQRFTNEAGHYAIVYNDAIARSSGASYMVFDSGAAFAPYTGVASGLIENENVFVADSLEALASEIGVDAAALVATVETYNGIAGGAADEFGKPAQVAIPLGTAPYYAVTFYPYNMGTIGGVKTTDEFEVLAADGTVIPGLYAAGEMCNRPFYNQVYMSGSALQVAGTSGQIAGANAAAYAAK